MKILNTIKSAGLILLSATVVITSCNKLSLDPVPIQPVQSTSPALATLLDDPDLSLFKAAVVRVGLLPSLQQSTLRYTVLAPNDAALAGLAAALYPGAPALSVIKDSLSLATVTGLVQYHILPQVVGTSSFSTDFPNIQYPTILNPSVGRPSYNALVRSSAFPSKGEAGTWVNNIPVLTADVLASNGVLHKMARVLSVPTTPLWQRIATDPNLTFLKAAIQRADSGTTATTGVLNPNNLQSVLTEFGPQITVFAPTDDAFKAVLYATAHPIIYQMYYQVKYDQAILGGATADEADAAANAFVDGTTSALTSSPTVFQNPALFSVLTATDVKGIVVYHLLGKTAFSVNFSNTATNYPTLLNSAIPSHPGISVTATFTGPSVSALKVKGLGNPIAANVLINPLPNPYGSSDQFYYNGTIHKIDQVLMPR